MDSALLRPFRAFLRVVTPIPGALPRAVMSCPFGAKTRQLCNFNQQQAFEKLEGHEVALSN